MTSRTVRFSARLLLVVLAVPFAVTAGAHAPGATTVVLVRHAEKVADGSRDPALTAPGHERATRLAQTLGHVELAAIYATPFDRSRSTAAPTAERQGLEVTTVGVDGDHVGDMVGRLHDHAGEAVLVVGHSNTIPEIVRGLGCAGVPPIADDEYDDLWVVTVGNGGDDVRCLHLAY